MSFVKSGLVSTTEPEPVKDPADVGVVVVPLEAVLLRLEPASLLAAAGGGGHHALGIGMSLLWFVLLSPWNVVGWPAGEV